MATFEQFKLAVRILAENFRQDDRAEGALRLIYRHLDDEGNEFSIAVRDAWNALCDNEIAEWNGRKL